MPRRRRRIRQGPEELQEPEASGKRRPDPDEARGKTAGLPRFLQQAADESVVELPAANADQLLAAESEQELVSPEMEAEGANAQVVAALSEVSGAGVESHLRAHNITLRGRTDADFSSSFRTRNVRTRSAAGCENCPGSDCVRVTGVLESTFTVRTTVTLPAVDDFPDLTACQRERVENAITNVLAPHEQQHVEAFRTYTGTVRTPFDLTLCRSEFESHIQELHESIEGERRQDAQDASDALDLFDVDVDLNCED